MGNRVIGCILGLLLTQASAGGCRSTAAVQVLRLDAREMVIHWRGAGEEPVQPVIVAVPPGSQPEIDWSVPAWEQCSAPPSSHRRIDGTPVARILAGGISRGLHLVSIGLDPWRPDGRGGWERASEIRVRLRHEAPPAGSTGRADRLQQHLSALAANPREALSWRRAASVADGSTSRWNLRAARDDWAYKASVAERGVYRLRGSDLDVEGSDPRNFWLEAQGRQQAIWMTGQEDGSFDPADELIFFGAPFRDGETEEDQFTDVQVYWISEGTEPGRRFQALASPPGTGPDETDFPERLHLEENLEASWPGDHFIWDLVRAGEQRDFTLEVPQVSPEDDGAILRYSLWGYTSLAGVEPDHHIRLWFNGRLVLDTTFDGYQQLEGEVELLPGELLEGDNILRIQCPGDTGAGEVDAVAVDWFEVEYLRIYRLQDGFLACRSPEGAGPGTVTIRVTGLQTDQVEVLDRTAEKRLTDLEVQPAVGGYRLRFSLEVEDPQVPHRLAIFEPSHVSIPSALALDTPSDWADPGHGADLLVVTHEAFRDALAPYVQMLRDRGLRVEIVDVQDVYDEFSYGVFQPPAIRDLVRHAYLHWERPAPEALLLVGDASWDYKGYIPDGVYQNFVPSYGKDFFDTDPAGGGAAGLRRQDRTSRLPPDRPPDPSSFTYGEAMVDNQFVCVDGPDNLPDLMVARLPATTEQEAQVVIAKWMAQAVQLPTGSWRRAMSFLTGGVNDTEQDFFMAQVDTLVDRFVQPEWNGFDVTRIDKESDGYGWGEYEQQVKDAIDQGQALVNFFGHAGTWSWEAIFDFDDLGDLQNQGRLPLVCSMTCNTLRFANPEVQSFGERFLISDTPQTGAAYVWGGYNFGDFWSDYYLSYSFFRHALSVGNGSVGSTIMLSMTETLLNYPWYEIITEPYTYLGDPYARFPWGYEGDPALWLGGYGTTRLGAATGGPLQMLAYVFDPDGPHDVSRVELTYDGIPTGVLLMDDGSLGDFGVRDGIYGLYAPIDPGAVPAARVLFGLKARDMSGATVSGWPVLSLME